MRRLLRWYLRRRWRHHPWEGALWAAFLLFALWLLVSLLSSLFHFWQGLYLWFHPVVPGVLVDETYWSSVRFAFRWTGATLAAAGVGIAWIIWQRRRGW